MSILLLVGAIPKKAEIQGWIVGGSLNIFFHTFHPTEMSFELITALWLATGAAHCIAQGRTQKVAIIARHTKSSLAFFDFRRMAMFLAGSNLLELLCGTHRASKEQASADFGTH